MSVQMDGARRKGTRWGGTMSGPVLADQDADGNAMGTGSYAYGERSTVALSGHGEAAIMKSTRISGQPKEVSFRGGPVTWKVTNRAQKGNVKVWSGMFDGQIYPEGATEDRMTWLQPGETMFLPLEAALHFVGNVFNRDVQAIKETAEELINRTGGFELDTPKVATLRGASVRPIGGPIGLPDFVVEPIDGRGRSVRPEGFVGAVAVYDVYVQATRFQIMSPLNKDKDVLEAAKAMLDEQKAGYTLDDLPLYLGTGAVASTALSRAAGDTAFDDDGEAATDQEDAEAESGTDDAADDADGTGTVTRTRRSRT